jgi:CheY-like chemotaxis protein
LCVSDSGVDELKVDFLNVFKMVETVAPLRGIYDPWLVGTSVAIAVLAAFTARMVAAASWQARCAWASAGVCNMGGGIRTKWTPIVALTAHALNDARDRCLAAGMDDFFVKQFDNRQMAATLLRWLVPSGTMKRNDTTAGVSASPTARQLFQRCAEIASRARNSGVEAAKPLVDASDDDLTAAIRGLQALIGELHAA